MSKQVQPLKRPGLVTFAAIMLFVVAGMHLVTGLEFFSEGSTLRNATFSVFGDNYTVSGIVELVIAAVLALAGFDILRGGSFGRWLGVIMAALSAIRSFWFVWLAPVSVFLVIGLDSLIIYGLIMSSEYFDRRR